MQVTITEFVLPNGRKKYHTHEFPDTENLAKVIEAGAAFEFEQLTTGHWSLEIAVRDEDDDPVKTVSRLMAFTAQGTIASEFEGLVEELGAQL